VLECLCTVAKSNNQNPGKTSEKTNRINQPWTGKNQCYDPLRLNSPGKKTCFVLLGCPPALTRLITVAKSGIENPKKGKTSKKTNRKKPSWHEKIGDQHTHLKENWKHGEPLTPPGSSANTTQPPLLFENIYVLFAWQQHQSAPQYNYILLHLIHSSHQQCDLVASPLSLTT